MKLHVGNLSPKVTEEELRQLFGKYGIVISVEIQWSCQAGRESGVAIVQMNIHEALTAARQLNGRAFRSRRLYISSINDLRVTPQMGTPSRSRQSNLSFSETKSIGN